MSWQSYKGLQAPVSARGHLSVVEKEPARWTLCWKATAVPLLKPELSKRLCVPVCMVAPRHQPPHYVHPMQLSWRLWCRGVWIALLYLKTLDVGFQCPGLVSEMKPTGPLRLCLYTVRGHRWCEEVSTAIFKLLGAALQVPLRTFFGTHQAQLPTPILHQLLL